MRNVGADKIKAIRTLEQEGQRLNASLQQARRDYLEHLYQHDPDFKKDFDELLTQLKNATALPAEPTSEEERLQLTKDTWLTSLSGDMEVRHHGSAFDLIVSRDWTEVFSAIRQTAFGIYS